MSSKEILNTLFDRHYNALCYFANSFLKDQDTAKDLVQEAFIGLWHNLDNIQDAEDKSLAYLYKSVRNKCLNYIRDQKVRELAHVAIRQDSDDWEDELIHRLIKAEVIGTLHHSLDKLPERCKKILKMTYLYGMSEKDIAESLSISVSTVKNQKKRGKQLIKEGLENILVLLLSL